MSVYFALPKYGDFSVKDKLELPIGTIFKLDGRWVLENFPCQHDEATDAVREIVNYTSPRGDWEILGGEPREIKPLSQAQM